MDNLESERTRVHRLCQQMEETRQVVKNTSNGNYKKLVQPHIDFLKQIKAERNVSSTIEAMIIAMDLVEKDDTATQRLIVSAAVEIIDS